MSTAALWAGWSRGLRVTPGPLMGASEPGVPILPGILNAELYVEVAWGADLTDLDGSSWVWTDITRDIYQKQDSAISVKVGRGNEASRAQPATCSFVLNNTGGKYSLGGLSPNWPNVKRNTPLRVTLKLVNLDPRVIFQGYVDGFTPGWSSLRGNGPIVSVAASGILRRLSQGDPPLNSAIRRAYEADPSVVAYWPCEEGRDATLIEAVIGGSDMNIVAKLDSTTHLEVTSVATPNFASYSSFDCSKPIPVLNGSRWSGLLPNYTNTGSVTLRYLLHISARPTSGTDPDIATSVLSAIGFSGGTINEARISYTRASLTEGLIISIAYNNFASTATSATFGFGIGDLDVELELALTQNGANVDYNISTYTVGEDGVGFASGTFATQTMGTAYKIDIGPTTAVTPEVQMNFALGHVIFQNAVSGLFEDLDAVNAFSGEIVTSNATHNGIGRLWRLTTEGNIPIEAFASSLSDVGLITDEMGSQLPKSMLTLLRECEDADGGLLFDGRSIGLTYVSRRAFETHEDPVTIDASLLKLGKGFTPLHDDNSVQNRVTISKQNGGSSTYEDVDGESGTAVIGTYDVAKTINYQSDDAASLRAGWEVFQGTIQGYRFPQIMVDFAATPELAFDLIQRTVGAAINVSNPRSVLEALPIETIRLTIEGYEWSISQYGLKFIANCSSWERWNVGLLSATTGTTSTRSLMRLDTDGASIGVASLTGATSLTVTTPSGPLWTTNSDDFPFYAEIAGIPVQVTGITGSTSPQTFTVTGSDVLKPFVVGDPVQVWKPTPLGL
jgi:hypothetical protein